MKIEMSLWSDYVSILRRHLIACGFRMTGAEKDEAIVIGFLNWQKRQVHPASRKIHLSKTFQCPSQFVEPMAIIKKVIEEGLDMTPYLSKKIEDFDYSDQMLNDWGIHHMHLGESLEASGFVKRTGPLLFVRFTETDAYFVNVLSHGAWTKQEIVKTIHDNWPSLIAQYKLKDVISLRFRPTDDDVATLRGAHINTMLQLDDGVVYAPIGMGSMSDGTATDVMMHLITTRKNLREAEKAVRQEVMNKPSTFSGREKLKFLLELNGANAHAVEKNSRIAYKLW
jgi:hypothetical protein